MIIRLVFMWGLLFPVGSFASTWSLYGYGARNQGQGNASLTQQFDAFSQAYNPAVMALKKETFLSFGFEGALASFENINQVVVDTPELSGTANNYPVGDVSTNTRDVFIFNVAYKTPLGDYERPIHFGFHLSSPVEHVLGIDTQDSFLPQYAMYLSDSQRFSMGLNLSRTFGDWFSVGAGGNIFLVQAAASQSRLPTGGNSTSRLKMDVKPGLAPVIGLLFHPGNTWKFGAVYQGRQDNKMQLDLNTYIKNVGPIPIIVASSSSLFFDPDYYSLGASFEDEKQTLSVSARYEKWSGFSGTTLLLVFKTLTNSFQQVLPNTNFHDVISLRAGYEYRYEASRLRLGYGYLPTPVPDQSGEANILDTDKHVATLGYGFDLPLSWFHRKTTLDLAGFIHYLVPKKIEKTLPTSIGAPGYTIAGSVYGYVATMTLEY